VVSLPGKIKAAAPLGARERAEALAAALPPLLIAADRVASTVAQGVHGRRRVGQGDTFWQFRRYEPGDPPQRIDWRRSAKAEPVFVRETEWEAAQSVYLWCDGSPSMDYASAKDLPTKAARARLLLLALAALLARGGERVALLGGGFPALTGRVALDRVATLLERSGALEAGMPPLQSLPRHSHLILIGDFLGPLDRLNAAIQPYVARGCRGALLHIVDPAEEALPFRGRIRFEGLEAEGHLLFGRTEDVAAAYAERFAAHSAALGALARSAGWSLTRHRTDRSAQSALLALYALIGAGVGRSGARAARFG
jgi:uncharacterized protein (DUF58 family)